MTRHLFRPPTDRTDRRRVIAMTVLAIITLPLEACSMSHDPRTAPSTTAPSAVAAPGAVADEIKRTHRVDWSLTPPLTRSRTGMEAGKTEVIYSPLDELLHVRLRLAGGAIVETDADVVEVTATSVDLEPNHLAVIRYGLAADRVQELLDGYETSLGVDAAKVSRWRAQSDAVAQDALGTSPQAVVFEGTTLDNTSVEVQAVTDRGSTHVGIQLLFTWPV
jgi:hypothetical protein